jgi:hypothetical protein
MASMGYAEQILRTALVDADENLLRALVLAEPAHDIVG